MPGQSKYRDSDAITLVRTVLDDGHLYICTSCKPDSARHGGPVYGRRDILIKKCAAHLNKGGLRDEDLARLEKNSWQVDPPTQRFEFKRKVVGKCDSDIAAK